MFLSLLSLYLNKHELLTSRKMKLYESSSQEDAWKPIRINLDYKYILTPAFDALLCTYTNQPVLWKYNTTCKESQILSQEKLDILIGTLENVRNFLSRLIRVIPYDKPINLEPMQDYRYITFQYDSFHKKTFPLPYKLVPFSQDEKPVEDTDLYIPVLSRPYPSSAPPASGSSLVIDNETSRPIVGMFIINPENIPQQIESENTESSTYFWAYLREMITILGFDHRYYSKFHPYENNEPHSTITCSVNKYNQNHKLLVTPYAHKWAQKHYSIDQIVGDGGHVCLSGIELENEEFSNEFGNHLKMSKFFTDVMTINHNQPSRGKFTRLTDATLAVLQDTGNYKCNWSLAQPLVWGNKESIGNDFNTEFAFGRPQNSYPSQYFANYSNGAHLCTTSFDFKYYGEIQKIATNSIDCGRNNNNGFYCSNKEFYNPNKWTTLGSDKYADRIPYVAPTYTICGAGEALLPSDYSNDGNQQCGEYQCWGFDAFSIKVYTNIDKSTYETVECTPDNIGQEFDIPLKSGENNYSRKVWCPNPERFCRTMKLYDTYFDHDPFEVDHDLPPHPTPTLHPTQSPHPTPQQTPQPTPDPTSTPTPTPPDRTPAMTPQQTLPPKTPRKTLFKIEEPNALVAQEVNESKQRSQTIIFIVVGIVAVVAVVEVTIVGVRYSKSARREAFKQQSAKYEGSMNSEDETNIMDEDTETNHDMMI